MYIGHRITAEIRKGLHFKKAVRFLLLKIYKFCTIIMRMMGNKVTMEVKISA